MQVVWLPTVATTVVLVAPPYHHRRYGFETSEKWYQCGSHRYRLSVPVQVSYTKPPPHSKYDRCGAEVFKIWLR